MSAGRSLAVVVVLASHCSDAPAQKRPVTSPQDAQGSGGARDKVFTVQNPQGLTPFALGAEIYHACMRRLVFEPKPPREWARRSASAGVDGSGGLGRRRVRRRVALGGRGTGRRIADGRGGVVAGTGRVGHAFVSSCRTIVMRRPPMNARPAGTVPPRGRDRPCGAPTHRATFHDRTG